MVLRRTRAAREPRVPRLGTVTKVSDTALCAMHALKRAHVFLEQYRKDSVDRDSLKTREKYQRTQADRVRTCYKEGKAQVPPEAARPERARKRTPASAQRAALPICAHAPALDRARVLIA
jgi:hypothetical protein